MTGFTDDQGLVDACRAGQSEAFGILVRRYQDRLYPTLLRLTGCAEDASDLLQTAFLRAFEKLGRFHGDSSFYTWIYRIAVNLALSDRRRRSLRRVAPARGGDVPESADDQAASDPALPLERAERDAQIQQALNALPPDYRAVVVLKDLDGLRYEQIADVLGVPVGTVRSRLHRARAELRDRLKFLLDEADLSIPSRNLT